jgi:hypothetical protein
MVGRGEEPPEKTVEEIQREAEEEIARAACLARDAKNGKRHNGLQDDSGASDDEPRDDTPLRRHHPKFNSRHTTDRDRLRDQSRSIQEEIGRIEYQGEQVYRMPAHNALASRVLIDQITTHLPKDNEEVNAHVKRFQAMLDAATMVDMVHDLEDGDQGHEFEHRQSPHGDLTSIITPPEERGRWRG